MNGLRTALVFDDRPRPETTGGYCLRALKELARVRHVLPEQLPAVAVDEFDLFVRIDDGLPLQWPARLRPCAYWAIDTHLDPAGQRAQALRFDRVFAAQRDGAEKLRAGGIESAQWLPLACDPAVHRPVATPVLYDLAFVGNVLPGPRTELLQLLRKRVPAHFIGRAYFEEMARIYSAARVVFNRSVLNDVNMRVFEALGCGAFLLTNALDGNGQAELFQDGVHLATYRDAEELFDKLQFYLAHEELRRAIAGRGQALASSQHTYRQRMQFLLETCADLIEPRFVPAASVAPRVVHQPARDARPSAAAHDAGYYEFARPEVAALVPAGADRILDIGCGAGRLGQSLRTRPARRVSGIELDPRAAEAARSRLDEVWQGDVERDDPGYAAGSFECVILADVLEHVRRPRRLLRQVHRWLNEQGALVLSYPNVRHQTVVESLLAGNWSYEPAGLLDRTHVRLLTRSRLQALLEETGFEVQWWEATQLANVASLGPLAALAPTTDEFSAYQWLCLATPARSTAAPPPGETPVWPAVQVLMVTYNRLDYTRLALESVLAQNYPGPWDLWVWDNASSDGTPAYLQERLRDVPYARVLASPVNVGVVRPMNEVWQQGTAPLLAKVDNDTWVPPDWLRRLVACQQASDKLGVLSGFHFREEGAALAEAARLRQFGQTTVLPQPYVGGCAVVLRRAIYEQLGPIPFRAPPQAGPFMDSGWTYYQQQIGALGLVNGYPWPPLHVDHMEDVRSPRAIRTPEHQAYKQDLRGMSLEEFTAALCVWRPDWLHDGDEAPAPSSPAAVDPSSQRWPTWPNGARRFEFTQDFVRDFDQVQFEGPPFALARFGDGERAILQGRPLTTQDAWTYAGGPARLREQLWAALQCDLRGYYLGISDGCCDPAAHAWYQAQVRLPLPSLTFANLFVNGNYRRFQARDLRRCAIVASAGGDFRVPADAFAEEFDVDPLIEELLAVDRPILVAAGPLACVLVHRYWQRATRPQIIVDVGSTLDERTKGRTTRAYQLPGTRTADLICTW